MEKNELLKELLTYIEQVEKLKSIPAFTVPEEHFSVYQKDLRGLPGVVPAPKNDQSEVWLELSRLTEILPPDPDIEINDWVTLYKSPEKYPELKLEIVKKNVNSDYEPLYLKDFPEIKEIFDWYVENLWKPWAESEKPRRKTIELYSKLFSLKSTLGSNLEIVWGVGLALWREPKSKKIIKHPLLTHPCEILIDEKTYVISIVPRNRASNIELDCYLSLDIRGYTNVEQFWKTYIEGASNQIDPYDLSTYEEILKNAVAYLDANGAYLRLEEGMVVPVPNENLLVTDSFVIFVRKRAQDLFIEDLHKLMAAIESSTKVPDVLTMLVSAGSEDVVNKETISFRGLSSSFGGSTAQDLFFPMPYNDEQVSIIQKLETSYGVVVQGPPGTGKTHTIANVICHYLAQGKKILVTAKSESALKVLQEKLPDQIKPLSVALLTDEADGMKKFEHSIQAIATRVSEIDANSINKDIERSEALLGRLHSKISSIDIQINDYAAAHMCTHNYLGRDIEIVELAKIVNENCEKVSWLTDDLKIDSLSKINFGDEDITKLRDARKIVGSDIVYCDKFFPVVDDFPEWIDVLALHHDLFKAKSIDLKISEGSVYPLKDSTLQTYEQIPHLLSFLNQKKESELKLNFNENTWLKSFQSKYLDLSDGDPVKITFNQITQRIEQLAQSHRAFIASFIVIPTGIENDPDVNEGLQRLSQGKKVFTLPFRKSEARKLIAEIQIEGGNPSSPTQWQLVINYLEWIKQAEKILSIWKALSQEFSIPEVSVSGYKDFNKISEVVKKILAAIDLNNNFYNKFATEVELVFSQKISINIRYDDEVKCAELLVALEEHGLRFSLNSSLSKQKDLLNKLAKFDGDISKDFVNFFSETIGSSVDESSFRESWFNLIERLKNLSSKRGHLQFISSLTNSISNAGAVEWSRRLKFSPVMNGDDEEFHPDWYEVWNLKVAQDVLNSIDRHTQFIQLFKDRKDATNELSKTYQQIIADKTWLGVYKNSPDSVRQALQAYLNAIQKIGAGTGKRAPRYRANAQAAMESANKAVPCWILPQWRVSESLPAELGLFDLVVIDEASQSDIWALPSMMRGKKLLIVGDHKQVSPLAIGTAEVRIDDLIKRFIPNQPHGAQMTPEKSIYDLGRVVFAGNSIMLKEHFRCVPAIIEFSNREFYENEIRPLRIPLASERLDPPLMDVYVKGGYKKGETNPPEALAIVNEIQKIIENPSLAGRTIGVVTLRGIEQGKYISSLISQRIDQKEILSRKIDVGQPAYFQGSERDIMMVSLVLAPGDTGAPKRADMEQRFNVALSRARDRMYLFRSVLLGDYKEDSLTAKVIRHFTNPFTQDAAQLKNIRELCESDFEREMFDYLSSKNYRVTPQVKCGGYRIDMVVEGAQGRRLAIECDGDRFHGPGQWSDDMARQRVLERAGWAFWRCFASSFTLRRDEVLTDLMTTLEKKQIGPIGAATVDNSMWVSNIEVDPYEVESKDDETLL